MFILQTQSKGASNKIRLGNQSSSQGSTESSSASGLSRGMWVWIEFFAFICGNYGLVGNVHFKNVTFGEVILESF